MLQYLNKHGPLTPIYYKPKPSIVNKTSDNVDYLRVYIKTHPGKIDIDTVSIYLLIFKTGSTKELMKSLVLFNNVLNNHKLMADPQRYEMTDNLRAGKYLVVFEQKS